MEFNNNDINLRTTHLNNLILGINTAAAAPISKLLSDGLHRENLLDALYILYNECNKEYLKQKDKNIYEFVNRYKEIIREADHLRITVNDFNLKSIIGKGYFGDVYFSYEISTQDIYAIKKIRKSALLPNIAIKEERDIMVACGKSEWITSLQYAFQDKENLYLVMEYLPGGDLLSLMLRNGAFNEDLIRFYLAELLLALNTLHNLGFVHRDVKPENILLDRFGHLKLADFGNAAHLNKDGNVKILTPVGTPDYIAPELLQTISSNVREVVHGVACDYWSMGIIGYELLTESTPFHEDNIVNTYSRILKYCDEKFVPENLQYPVDLNVTKEFRNLMDGLIKNSKFRFSYKQILKHPFFNDINFKQLRQSVPPIIPNLSSDDDLSNFDDINNKSGRRSSNSNNKSIQHQNQQQQQQRQQQQNKLQFDDQKNFSGYNLPFLGYSYINENDNIKQLRENVTETNPNILKTKLNDVQLAMTDQVKEIEHLKMELLKSQKNTTQTEIVEKILIEAKNELNNMKEQLKLKTIALAESKTDVKTLQNSLKLVEEMRIKNDENIAELLNSTYQKWERAKKVSDQNYEKQIAEKKTEILSIKQDLQAREQELNTKVDKCKHLQDTVQKYKELLNKSKEQNQIDKNQLSDNKNELINLYKNETEQNQLILQQEREQNAKFNEKMQNLQIEYEKSTISNKNLTESKLTIEKNLEDLKLRYDKLLIENKLLRKENYEFIDNNMKQKRTDEILLRKKRYTETQLIVTGNNNSNNNNNNNNNNNKMNCYSYSNKNNNNNNNNNSDTRRSSDEMSLAQFKSCRTSLESLNSNVEEQLRNDLTVAREHETKQRYRADRLEETVARLENAIEQLNTSKKSQSINHLGTSSPDQQFLEKKNEQLEHKLDSVKEQAIVDRQASRSAYLSLYKLEKQIENFESDKKLTERTIQQLNNKIQSIGKDKDNLNCKLKEQQLIVQHKDNKIDELIVTNKMLSNDLNKQYEIWKQSEDERIKNKTEIIENVFRINNNEDKLREQNQQLNLLKSKNEQLMIDLKKIQKDKLIVENELSQCLQRINELEKELISYNKNYDTLKETCKLTDTQFTEIELLYEEQLKCNNNLSNENDKLWKNIRNKDEELTKLNQNLNTLQSDKLIIETKSVELQNELIELKYRLEQRDLKLLQQNTQISENNINLFKLQEQIDILMTDNSTLYGLNKNDEREIKILKEENTNLLTQLYSTKEEFDHLVMAQQTLKQHNIEMSNTIEQLNIVLQDQKHFYLQRDIKSEATQQQLKKLINYLQQRVEELSKRKKKTLVDVLFGINTDSTASTKYDPEQKYKPTSNTLPATLSNRYQEDLLREKLRNNKLTNDLFKTKTEIHNIKKKSNCDPAFDTVATPQQLQPQQPNEHQRVNSATVTEAQQNWLSDRLNNQETTNVLHQNDHRNKIESKTSNSIENEFKALTNYTEKVLFKTNDFNTTMEIFCIYQIFENILLLGTDSGLYSFHLDSQQLILLNGLKSCNWIAAHSKLSKSILIGSNGEALYQLDYLHLKNRAQASVFLKPKLEIVTLDLSAITYHLNDRWHSVRLHDKNDELNEAIAIAAATSKIVILKFNTNNSVFQPIQALDTAIPVTSIYFSKHTAIIASNKFFEMDLEYFSVEEFLDMSDVTVTHAKNCKSMAVFQINNEEYLLCFKEFGIFVDEYGCRSRPSNINWIDMPITFWYSEPFLYCFYLNQIQIITIYKRFSKELKHKLNNNDNNNDDENISNNMKFNVIKLNQPKFFGCFGNTGILVGCKSSMTTNYQEILIIDGCLNSATSMSSIISTIPSESDV